MKYWNNPCKYGGATLCNILKICTRVWNLRCSTITNKKQEDKPTSQMLHSRSNFRVYTRGIFRGVSEVSRNQSGLLNWYNITIHSNKTFKVYGSYSNIKCNFCTSTWNILYLVSYGRLHPPHSHPSNTYTIG